jgi:hypothetical protein
LVTVNLSLANGTQLAVDLSETNLMVAMAFILGTSPWPLWKFIENTARKFTGQLDQNG